MLRRRSGSGVNKLDNNIKGIEVFYGKFDVFYSWIISAKFYIRYILG
jgi:hypothetical protein